MPILSNIPTEGLYLAEKKLPKKKKEDSEKTFAQLQKNHAKQPKGGKLHKFSLKQIRPTKKPSVEELN